MKWHRVSSEIMPTPPFDFALSLAYMRSASPISDGMAIFDDAFRMAASIEGQTMLVEVSSSGGVEAPRLTYELASAETIDDEIRTLASNRLKGFLSVEDNLRPFYERAASDPHFSPLAERLYGYHHVRFAAPFEAACWSVLAQRNGIAAALTLKRRIVERYGTEIEANGQRFKSFPEPLDIATCDANELYGLLPNLRRAEYMMEVARAFIELDESFVRNAPYGEAEARLRSIKGIGEWSAGFVLMRGFGRMDKVPRAEKRLAELTSKYYGEGYELTDAEAYKIASEYGPHAGCWFHYLRAGDQVIST